MKTAISLPDPLFEAAEELLETFIQSHQRVGVTERLNRPRYQAVSCGQR